MADPDNNFPRGGFARSVANTSPNSTFYPANWGFSYRLQLLPRSAGAVTHTFGNFYFQVTRLKWWRAYEVIKS